MAAKNVDRKETLKVAVNRPTLERLTGLAHGKRVRLHRLLYEHGPANGTLLLLPIDQGLEHGPIDMFDNPDSIDPTFQWELALEGAYSGIALHYGLAERYMGPYAGKVPLLLKLNGKTTIPPDDEALSPVTAVVEDAVRLGADAVGYTLYVGSPRQDEDFLQLVEIRRACDEFGMPLVVWSYPRGSAIETKGGRDSVYAVDYAARVAHELGADVIKLNAPKGTSPDSPKPYNELDMTPEEMLRKVIISAGNSMVLLSGGSKISDDDLLTKVGMAMEAGATGLIFGRNMWQRRKEDALAITKRVKEVLARYSA
jgi:class I fructose-bisphosphate aldolase